MSLPKSDSPMVDYYQQRLQHAKNWWERAMLLSLIELCNWQPK
ncbi:hypothetical protein [Vibrio paucivorans]